MSMFGTLIAIVSGIEINKLMGRISMKHLILILSFTLIAGVANAGGGMNNDCPYACLLYTSPSPRDQRGSRMPSSA